MKFVLISASLFLLPLAAQAEQLGFSYQSQDGTIYTSTTAPSWCRRYYVNDSGNSYSGQEAMPYACANPRFTTSRAARKAPARGGEDAFPAGDHKADDGKKDSPREARVPPAPGRSRARVKEVVVEITPVLEANDEKEGKGLVPPAPIPPAPRRAGDGDDFGGKLGKKDRVPAAPVPPAPGRGKGGGEARVVIKGTDDPSGKGKKEQLPPVRTPPAPSRADLPPRPPLPVPDDEGAGGRFAGKGGKDQKRVVEVPPSPRYDDDHGKGKKEQKRVVEVPPSPRYDDDHGKGKKEQKRVVDVPPAPSYDDDFGRYDGKGKKEQKRAVQVPPAPARKSDSFLSDWGISLDALRARLQPVRVVQPSGKVSVSGVQKHRALTVEEASCFEGKPAEVLPLAPWMKDVQRITAGREPAAAKGDTDLLAAVRKRTPEQEKCAAEAPKSPSRVVLAFDAFGSFNYVDYYKEKNAQLPEKEAEAFRKGNAISNAARKEDREVPGVHWKYYSKELLEKEPLTPATRCAFELATKPYKTKDGKTVYNTITLVSHSFGGDAAFKVANTLKKLGVRVDLVLTTDPRQPLNNAKRVTFVRPDNVDRWVNFYQRNDPVLKGFPVDGAENVDVSDSGAWHGLAPHAPAARARAAEEVMRLPRCKSDLATSVYKQSAACTD